MKDKQYSMYYCHVNSWWWGKSVDIVRKDGICVICVKYDDKYPSTAFICDLSVLELYRHNGIGGELMKKALEVAKDNCKSFAELQVDKAKNELVAWYTDLGFDITYIDEHEYTMMKVL